MKLLFIPVLLAAVGIFAQLDTSKLGDNTWVSLLSGSSSLPINHDNWAYENDLQSSPFYGFFIMGPGHVSHPQDCKYYPFDPVKNKWSVIDPPRVPPRRCLSSFAVNSQDSLLIQIGGGEGSHQLSQGAWSSYSSIDMGGKRRGMWAYSFNRNEWYHILGPADYVRSIFLPSVSYDPVHDLAVTPYNDTTYLYNFHLNKLRKVKTATSFQAGFNSCAVDRRRGLIYVMYNNALYKFDPETEQYTTVPGTTPPSPTGAADGNETSINQLAYDEVNDVLVYTGDDNTSGGAPNINTWIFYCDSLKWTKMTTPTAPLDRGRLAYNRALNACMLLGGTANGGISRGGSTKGIWMYRYKRGPGVFANMAAAPSAVINTLGNKPLLSWKHSAESGVSGYNIYSGTGSPFPKGFLKQNTSAVTDTFYQDASAAASTPYAYRVCAVKNGIEGQMSRLLYATPGRVLDVVASVSDSQHIKLTWRPVSAGTVSGYNVYRALGSAGFAVPFPDSFVKITATPIAALEFLDSIRIQGYAKVYVVTAVNGLGLESGVSTECTHFPDSPERACAYSVTTSQGQQMAIHWQPPRRSRIVGVNLYHVHPQNETADASLTTLICYGADYYWQAGEAGHTYATRLNGTRTAPAPITDTVTYWPLPPAPQDSFSYSAGYWLQTQTYVLRSVNIFGQESFLTDQISPVNTEYGNGVIAASQRFNNSDWSPITDTDVENLSMLPAQPASSLDVLPNPFNGYLQVRFRTAAGKGMANVNIFNLAGQRIMSGAIGVKQGQNAAAFDLSKQPSGIYFVEVRTGTEKLTRRAVLVR